MKLDNIAKKFKNSIFILIIVLLLFSFGIWFFLVNGGIDKDEDVILRSDVEIKLERLAKGEVAGFTKISKPYKAPLEVFYDSNGAEVSFDDFLGEVLFVNLWASWCGPCRAEMPYIEKLQKIRQSPDFRVITISLDQSENDIKKFFQEYNITALPGYIDKKLALNRGFLSVGLPNSYIIDKDGYVIGKLAGAANWSSKEAVSLIDYVIEKGFLTQRLSILE